MIEKKKILLVSANPKETERLSLDEEFREICECIERSKFKNHFEIKQCQATRASDLRRVLLDFKPNFVHFAGHGKKSGIILESEKAFPIPTKHKALVNLFKHFVSHLKCVILNACDSKPIANAISKHINYVVGMKEKINDRAAIEFAMGFYDALGAGKNIEEAFEIGKNALELLNLPGYDIPVLRIKDSKNKKNTGMPTSLDGNPLTLTIRSFIHPAQKIVETADHMLCITELFNNRKLVKGTWEDLKQLIRQFLFKFIKAGKQYKIFVPLHGSLAFYTGRILDFKCGAEISVFQISPQLELWPLSPQIECQNKNKWNVEEFKTGNDGHEIAFALSVAQPIISDVELYVKNRQPGISQLVHLYLDDVNTQSIKDSSHAFNLAYQAVAIFRNKSREFEATRLHLFFAAPVVFSVMLGQQSWFLNNITVYEYDPDAAALDAYSPSILV